MISSFKKTHAKAIKLFQTKQLVLLENCHFYKLKTEFFLTENYRMEKTNILSRPYPFNNSSKKRSIDAMVFSAFVFLFLYIFQPFQIGNFKEHTFTVSLGYGLVCLFLMILLNIVLPKLTPGYFDESRWTTGRQMFWTFVNVFLIGMGNFLFTASMNIISFSVEGILRFQFFTLAVGAFPIVISTLINQARLQAQYDKKSADMNAKLSIHDIQSQRLDFNQHETVTIPSKYAQDDLNIKLNQLLFIRAADNYVEVFFVVNKQIQKILLRNSLKDLEDTIKLKQLFRCHKSYLVNLDQVTRVSGNAQGYKLHLNGFDELIPVSRANNDLLKQNFEKKNSK